MSETVELSRRQKYENRMNKIPWFRRKVGDVFRAMVIPIAILAFLSIISGVLESVYTNYIVVKNLQNNALAKNILIAKEVFEKLMNFVPMIAAISVAATFSPNRTVGALTAFIGWIAFLAVQSVLIAQTGNNYHLSLFLQNRTIPVDAAEKGLIVKISGLTTNPLIFLNSNMFVGFLVGYLNALALSKITKKTSTLTNATFLGILIALAFSIVIGFLHLHIIFLLGQGLYASKDSIINLNKNINLNNFLTALINGSMFPLSLTKYTSSLYGGAVTEYDRVLLALFILPAMAIMLIFSAKKGNRRFAFSFYITFILLSTLLGKYDALLLSIFFISPFVFLMVGAIAPSTAAWVIAIITSKLGTTIETSLLGNGGVIDIAMNAIKNFAKFKQAWVMLLIGSIWAITFTIISWAYIYYGRVCVLGKGNVIKEMFAYEYVVENNYIVFSKQKNNDLGNPVRNQVADELVNRAVSLIAQNEHDAILSQNIISDAKRMKYTKEITIDDIDIQKAQETSDIQDEIIFDEPDNLLIEEPSLDLDGFGMDVDDYDFGESEPQIPNPFDNNQLSQEFEKLDKKEDCINAEIIEVKKAEESPLKFLLEDDNNFNDGFEQDNIFLDPDDALTSEFDLDTNPQFDDITSFDDPTVTGELELPTDDPYAAIANLKYKDDIDTEILSLGYPIEDPVDEIYEDVFVENGDFDLGVKREVINNIPFEYTTELTPAYDTPLELIDSQLDGGNLDDVGTEYDYSSFDVDNDMMGQTDLDVLVAAEYGSYDDIFGLEQKEEFPDVEIQEAKPVQEENVVEIAAFEEKNEHEHVNFGEDQREEYIEPTEQTMINIESETVGEYITDDSQNADKINELEEKIKQLQEQLEKSQEQQQVIEEPASEEFPEESIELQEEQLTEQVEETQVSNEEFELLDEFTGESLEGKFEFDEPQEIQDLETEQLVSENEVEPVEAESIEEATETKSEEEQDTQTKESEQTEVFAENLESFGEFDDFSELSELKENTATSFENDKRIIDLEKTVVDLELRLNEANEKHDALMKKLMSENERLSENQYSAEFVEKQNQKISELNFQLQDLLISNKLMENKILEQQKTQEFEIKNHSYEMDKMKKDMNEKISYLEEQNAKLYAILSELTTRQIEVPVVKEAVSETIVEEPISEELQSSEEQQIEEVSEVNQESLIENQFDSDIDLSTLEDLENLQPESENLESEEQVEVQDEETTEAEESEQTNFNLSGEEEVEFGDLDSMNFDEPSEDGDLENQIMAASQEFDEPESEEEQIEEIETAQLLESEVSEELSEDSTDLTELNSYEFDNLEDINLDEKTENVSDELVENQELQTESLEEENIESLSSQQAPEEFSLEDVLSSNKEEAFSIGEETSNENVEINESSIEEIEKSLEESDTIEQETIDEIVDETAETEMFGEEFSIENINETSSLEDLENLQPESENLESEEQVEVQDEETTEAEESEQTNFNLSGEEEVEFGDLDSTNFDEPSEDGDLENQIMAASQEFDEPESEKEQIEEIETAQLLESEVSEELSEDSTNLTELNSYEFDNLEDINLDEKTENVSDELVENQELETESLEETSEDTNIELLEDSSSEDENLQQFEDEVNESLISENFVEEVSSDNQEVFNELSSPYQDENFVIDNIEENVDFDENQEQKEINLEENIEDENIFNTKETSQSSSSIYESESEQLLIESTENYENEVISKSSDISTSTNEYLATTTDFESNTSYVGDNLNEVNLINEINEKNELEQLTEEDSQKEQVEALDEQSAAEEFFAEDEEQQENNYDFSQEFDFDKFEKENEEEIGTAEVEISNETTVEAETDEWDDSYAALAFDENSTNEEQLNLDENEISYIENSNAPGEFQIDNQVSNLDYSDAFTKPLQKRTYSFDSKIRQFMILSPLLGEIKAQSQNSISILSTSGKLIMPNDAHIDFISENRDKYILDIYGVKMEILLNPNFDKPHKQRLHNKIYANEGKQLYKGDFFIDGNKKFYSEIGEQMILKFTILTDPTKYEIKPLRHTSSRIEKWDGLFEIVLQKEYVQKLRVGQEVIQLVDPNEIKE
ncbi:hypothetical protein [Metamycoplasma hyosynoviae]|uniref:Uncharacterized protein n=1 Tax=Metamycoplasma hyosynoviae TaxID=29559 RepID=A0A9Q9F2S2_9BACT|nr:hypothetical protein [Metamycoplasma hyosynoviae]MDD1358441.1 hypothetical protein [Metamycoplasma hyosynoviae]MDD1361191.1 hypothetical protein [Metamycoplasma hyosynoviae]UTO26052.1 hypothetical protein NMG93_00585 [Metamycoplasma hyosynoviae]UTO26724.1 hypothetical protein NMG94_00585 [Metamycoplasma hyosynoviae]